MIMLNSKWKKLGGAIAVALASTLVNADSNNDVEVLHWWTSGSESKALQVLKSDLEAQGIGWKDLAIAGGGGDNAKTALRARVLSGQAPTAVQMLGFSIQEWAEQGFLANLNAVANEQDWDSKVPKALKQFSKYEDEWVSVPVNIHRTNWVWANKAIFEELNLPVPTTFEELLEVADKVREAGYIPLAHGGQAWQDATVFDSVVMSVGGPEFYKKAFVELDKSALQSDTMKKVFDRMREIRSLVDDNFSGRDWNLATSMVIRKEAAMQIMGDWAKGEFSSAGLDAGTDYLCFEFPGTKGSYVFVADQFTMFEVESERQQAQLAMANSILADNFQAEFNRVKGSVPANISVPVDDYDACGQKAMKDLISAEASNTLVGSIAHAHANRAAVQGAVIDTVTGHFNSDMSSEEAVEMLTQLIDGAL